MLDILFIIFMSGILTLIITYVKKYYNNKNTEERVPVENYDLIDPKIFIISGNSFKLPFPI